MKNYIRRLLAFGLSAAIFISSVPMQNVHAAEVQQENGLEEALLNYVYIEKQYLETPDTQNMYVSIGEEENGIDSAKLEVENLNTEEKVVLDAKEIIENKVLFSKDFLEENERGIYQIRSISVTAGSDTKKIDFESIDMYVYFGVNETVNQTPQTFSADSVSLDSYIVTIDEDGSTEAAESIESALQTVNNSKVRNGRAGNAVVMLDPGHDGTHKGAHQSGLEEEKLNLKIAKYCREELQEYFGVTVYMTRETEACPYPGTTSSECNKARVQDAANKGADIYVALHLNSFQDSSVSGAVVFCPNKNYNPSVGAEGKELAEKISEELVELGLNDRGVTIRNSEDHTLYPDGSLADYYGVIKNSKLHGIPAIIVEHAFMTNASDVNEFLKTEAGLKKLGVADATGIAKYFGLSKGVPAASKVTAEANASESRFTLTAHQVVNSQSVRFAVWSEKDGQDDLVWYNASNDGNGNWIADAVISNHKTVGTYQVHTYAKNGYGPEKYIGKTTFTVSSASIEKVSVENINSENGTFDIALKNVTGAGIKKIEVAVWSQKNQNDLKWYTAQSLGNGNYKVNVNVANHNYNYGQYYIDAYIVKESGARSYGGGTRATINAPAAAITAVCNGTETEAVLTARNVTIPGGIKSVRFAVWSEKGGQDDLIWYDGKSQGNGTWLANAVISRHKTAGNYFVHTYGTGVNGTRVYLGGTHFVISSDLGIQSVTAGNVNPEAGTFQVNLKGIYSVSGIGNIRAAVWSKSNQSDLKWYTVNADSDGTAQIQIDISNHNYNYGNYFVDLYMTGGNGIKVYAGGTTAEMSLPKAAVTAQTDAQEKGTAITARGIAVPGGVESVRFAVWSQAGGQDDLVWYDGRYQGGGTWSVSVDTARHKTAGIYFVHVYAKGKNGVNTVVGSTTFSISMPGVASVTAENVNPKAGTFDVNLGGIHSVSGVSRLQVAVWSRSDQKDLKWYNVENISGENYKINVNIANHNYNYGKYYVDAYLTSGNGIRKYAGGTTVNLPVPKAEVTVEKNAAETRATIKAENVAVSGGVAAVRVAVWSQTKGQDDLIWYDAVSDGKGAWIAVVDITRHKTAGLYYADTYVVGKNGTKHCAGGKTFTVSSAKAQSVAAVDIKEAAGRFSVKISDVSAPSGIVSVQAAVWSTANQSDLVWYNARNIGNNTYLADVNIRNHKNNIGTYQIHVYVTAGNGVKNAVGTTTCKILNVDGLFYSIMGKSTVTADQLVRYYNMNQKYPSFYASTDAPGIREFCQIYIEECAAEGVKAEVAFGQAMMETGYLQFGGDVKIQQFNFAGLGATGNGVPGHSFKNVRTGIRAQVQHLKAYASKEALKNQCVDPRFQYVKRGTAPYVEWLGIQENPYGAGWAAAKNYGIDMMNNYIKKIKSI